MLEYYYSLYLAKLGVSKRQNQYDFVQQYFFRSFCTCHSIGDKIIRIFNNIPKGELFFLYFIIIMKNNVYISIKGY